MNLVKPSQTCAELLCSSRGHTLKHVEYYNYSWKYKVRIWEELRPLNIGKIDYGGSNPTFLIKRKGIDRSELKLLCDWHAERIKNE